jgi:hypothetical protein
MDAPDGEGPPPDAGAPSAPIRDGGRAVEQRLPYRLAAAPPWLPANAALPSSEIALPPTSTTVWTGA